MSLGSAAGAPFFLGAPANILIILGRPSVRGGGGSAAGAPFFLGAPDNILIILGRPSVRGGGSDSADREDIDDRLVDVGTTGIIGATDVSISGNLNSDLNLGALYISFESSSSTISLIVPFSNLMMDHHD